MPLRLSRFGYSTFVLYLTFSVGTTFVLYLTFSIGTRIIFGENGELILFGCCCRSFFFLSLSPSLYFQLSMLSKKSLYPHLPNSILIFLFRTPLISLIFLFVSGFYTCPRFEIPGTYSQYRGKYLGCQFF